MSKSVRVTDYSYDQLNELKSAGLESLTNALSVAIEDLHRRVIREAERPKGDAMQVYTDFQWNRGMNTTDREALLRSAKREGKQAWFSSDGSVALATHEEIVDYAERTGDDDWTEDSDGAYIGLN